MLYLLSSKMSAAYSVVRAGKYEVTSRSLGCLIEELDERIGLPQSTRPTSPMTSTAAAAQAETIKGEIKMKNDDTHFRLQISSTAAATTACSQPWSLRQKKLVGFFKLHGTMCSLNRNVASSFLSFDGPCPTYFDKPYIS